MVPFWHHEETDSEECYNYNFGLTLSDIRGIEFTLMVGSEVTQPFLGENAGPIAGLWVASKYRPDYSMMAVPSVSVLMNGTVGEWRLALRKFVEGVQECQKRISLAVH